MNLLRFIYINIFAILLAILGVIFFILPKEYFLSFFKLMASAWCIMGGIALMFQWKAKKRKIELLVARNRNHIRPDTFRTVGGTLCGQQMVTLALSDLRKKENYRALSKAEWNLVTQNILGGTYLDSIFRLRRLKKAERR